MLNFKVSGGGETLLEGSVEHHYFSASLRNCVSGFTLIELSIVLVILGLLVGGVFSGRALIRAAEIRATIAQVDSLKVAARTFRDKYFYLPGDVPAGTAVPLGLSQYGNVGIGFTSGDGDGLITTLAHREKNLFFVHLVQKNMIAGSYLILGSNEDTNTNGRKPSDYILKAKMGGDQHIHVYNGGPNACHPGSNCQGADGFNYISIGGTTRYCHVNTCGYWGTSPTMATIDAYNIDGKVDDGAPQSGGIQAFHQALGSSAQWAGGEYFSTGKHDALGKPTKTANPAGATNCYDNGNVAGQPQQYTLSLNGGNNKTCALSFRM